MAKLNARGAKLVAKLSRTYYDSDGEDIRELAFRDDGSCLVKVMGKWKVLSRPAKRKPSLEAMRTVLEREFQDMEKEGWIRIL
jgi:hypothetical protein